MSNTLRRYTPHIVVFFGSLAVMIVELVASRLVAKYFGNSLYTWTGVIGVVLGGISLGNYVGGRLADRFDPARVIIPVLLVSSAATLLVLLLDALLGRYMGTPGSGPALGVLLRSVLVIALLFLLPSTALGAISPIMAKYALLHRDLIGRTVGNIYAISSIGSIAGTFLAGYLLIPLFDLRIIVSLVGFTVASLGLLIKGRRALTTAGIAGFLALGTAAFFVDAPLSASAGDVLYARFSQYSFIKVKDIARQGTSTGERVLIMDGLIHNRHDLANRDNLLYDYENIFAAASELVAPTSAEKRSLRALTLGGGALTFPSYLSRNFLPEENTVVEIDPRVEQVAYRYFDVPQNPGPSVVIGDARSVTAELRGRRTYDIIYLDAFTTFAVPFHLTTVEFTQTLSDLLPPDGILLANTIDILDGARFLTAYFNTLQHVFPNVRIYVDRTMNLHGRNTFVLCASKARTLPEILTDTYGSPVGFALTQGVLGELLARNGTTPITDNYAPVDTYMAPVYLRSVR